MSARSLLSLLALAASAAHAAPTIDPQFDSNSVIQRGKPIILSGDATPHEHVTVQFGDLMRVVDADSEGRWQAIFPERHEARPLSIKVSGHDGVALASNILVGDVWLCSGQSNMEYPLRRALNGDGEVQNALDPELRLMKIPQQLAQSPSKRFASRPSFRPASPESAKDFSAACYFMARELRASEHVPIGAIDDTWGGTPIRAWMDENSVRQSGGEEPAKTVDLFRTNATAAVRRFGNEWEAWWRKQTGDRPGSEPWNSSDRLSWKPVPAVGFWDGWGPEWKNWVGSIWVRNRVTLSRKEAAQGADLSLSAIDDLDQTFVNGIAVGGKNDPTHPRNYPVPTDVLRPGVNEILIFVRNLWGAGGLAGPAEKFGLTFPDGHSRPLASGWQYSRIADSVGTPPSAPWDGSSGVSTIYDAMVAPLGPLGLKGVAWYQGEADVGQADYDRRLGAWMANWRSQFRDPGLPFLIVGLAGWGKPVSHPVDSAWAALINEQRVAVERDHRTALASAIDLGEPADIHPANKQEVGRRLALAAHALGYQDGGAVGPMPISAVRKGSMVEISFTKPLQTLSGGSVNALELCGPEPGTCRYVTGHARGNLVEAASDGRPVARVRYAWADYPIVNLYDEELLPAPVFQLQVQ